MQKYRFICTLISTVLLSLMQSASALAQSPLDGKVKEQVQTILQRLQTERVSLKYKMVLDSDPAIHLEGSLILEGNCYLALGNGLEIYSDGTSRWTVDPQEKEVYIEDSTGVNEAFAYSDSVKELKISEVKYSPAKGEDSSFRFDTSKLDSSWVVTDLRGE